MKRTRLRARSRSASAKRRRAAQFGDQAERCRRLPCCVCGRYPADPHHEPPLSLGGKDEDTVPLCRKCHRNRHDHAGPVIAWWSQFDIDPEHVKRLVREARGIPPA